jgi:hypothetical protein
MRAGISGMPAKQGLARKVHLIGGMGDVENLFLSPSAGARGYSCVLCSG